MYIDLPQRELYDQSADPGALHNLVNSSRAVADTMVSQLEELRRVGSRCGSRPGSDEMHFYLGMAYDEIGRASDAAKNFQAALRINPNHYRANLLLGRPSLGMQNNPMAALPYLQKAVKPQSPDAHKFLANVYLELGQHENAARQ